MKPSRSFANPVFLLFSIMVSIFLADIVVMFILSILPPLSTFKTALLDGLLLTVITFPLLYFLILRPLRLHITERESAENLLKNSEEKYRSLVESTEDSIYLVDRNFRYLFMNQKHLSRLGLLGDEYIGHEYSEFHSSDVTEWFVKKVNEVFSTGASIHHEHKSLRDGRYFLLTLSPVKDLNGIITAITVVSKDITDRKNMEEKIRFWSLTDDLTGLHNRRGFFTLAEERLKLANRLKIGMFALYADVDNLKKINDTLGHHEGSRALIETANILKKTFRESDIIARIGGDEFVVIAIETGKDDAEILAARLQENLKNRNMEGSLRHNLSLSIGIVRYDPDSPCSIDKLLAHADKSMYEGKRDKQDS